MIRLFRKFRLQFLRNNKLGKYLLYATGEIVLIVIGILIALGINNWNQKQQLQKREYFYLQGLKEEFTQNKQKLATLISVNRMNYGEAKKLVNYMHSQQKPGEEELSGLLFKALSYDIDYYPNNALLTELISTGGLKTISNATLRRHLIGWEPFLQSVNRQERTLRDQREQLLDIFRTEAGSIRTILDHADISEQIMGLQPAALQTSNLAILESKAFENKLLMFILTGMLTESEHYQPLMEEVDTIILLIQQELEKQG